MKFNNFLFASLFICVASLSSCQQNLNVNVANQIEEMTIQKGSFKNQVDQYASYKEGIEALDQLIKERLDKVDLTKSFSAGDTAYLELTIDADGSILELVQLAPKTDNEAKELTDFYIAHLLNMPKWQPGIKNNEPVKSWVVLPLVFTKS